MCYPKSLESIDRFSIETHGDLGIHFKKPPNGDYGVHQKKHPLSWFPLLSWEPMMILNLLGS